MEVFYVLQLELIYVIIFDVLLVQTIMLQYWDCSEIAILAHSSGKINLCLPQRNNKHMLYSYDG